MSKHLSARSLVRLVAVLSAIAAPLLSTGPASAGPSVPSPSLPSPPPLPSPSLPPWLPQPGGPITVIIVPPSLATFSVQVPSGNCLFVGSYDNTGTSPPGSIFRGQTTCGSGVYQPTLSGQAVLKDVFGNVVAVAPAFSQTGGLGTSQGFLGSILVATGGTSGVVPGLRYTVEYDSSVTLNPAQTWGAPGPGCTISGQTERCLVSTPFDYIPGTKGGVTPA
jgi:hypothetical protein